MKKELPSIAALIAGFLITATLTGCRIYSDEIANDSFWMDGQMSTVINRQYRDRSLGNHSLGGGYDPVVKNDWILDKQSVPNKIGQHTRFKFYSLTNGGDQGQMFLSIKDSDLLIHQFPGALGVIQGQFALFDPKTGKDVTARFPPASTVGAFNRSRTKYTALVAGEAMILDVLSATNGAPKMETRPSWTNPLLRVQKGGMFVHLSEDTSCLIVVNRGYLSPPSGVDVWSTNQDSQHFTVPIKEVGSEIIGADSPNGEVLLLARRLLPSGSEDSLKILNKFGDAKYATVISAAPTAIHWDPPRHELLIGPDEVWNYQLNSR